MDNSSAGGISLDVQGLPIDDENALSQALRTAMLPAERSRNILGVTWSVIRLYLQGIRSFTAFDRMSGQVAWEWSDPGSLILYEEALSSCQEEIGRLMTMDLRPIVRPRGGLGLDSVRKAAVGQATLNYLYGGLGADAAKRTFLTYLVHYGTAGIMLQERTVRADDMEPTWRPRTEIIPPWQLLSMPGDVPDPSMAMMVGRQRRIPLPMLRAMSSKEARDQMKGQGILSSPIKLPADEAELDAIDIPLGQSMWEQMFTSPQKISLGDLQRSQDSNRFNYGGKKQTPPNSVPHVKVTEFWASTDGVNCDRYIVLMGKAIGADLNYRESGVQRPMPIGVGRYAEVGSFYGRGFAEARIEMNQITERLLDNLIRNVEDYDQFGITFLPRTWGIDDKQLMRRRDGGPRVAGYDPDPMPGVFAEAKTVQPATNADMPAKVLQLVSGLTDRVMKQNSIFSADAPQRADSAASLNTVSQESMKPLSAANSSIASAWKIHYRSLLGAARKQYGDKGVIPLVALDEALVGVMFDAKSGGISLSQNAVPGPEDVVCSVQSESPKNDQALGQWLMQAVQGENPVMTMREMRILARKNGLDFMPVANEGEWNAYETAVLDLIVIFADGKTPGTVELYPWANNVDVSLWVTKNFLAGPRVRVASPEVQMALQNHVENLEALLARGMPDQAPFPEQSAMISQQLGGGGMPPMMGMGA